LLVILTYNDARFRELKKERFNKFYNPFVLQYAYGTLLHTCMWTTLNHI